MSKMIVYGSRGGPLELNEELVKCTCGGDIEASLGFGRTPYSFFCLSCKTTFMNNVTNCDGNGAIKYFNLYIQGQEQPFEFKVYKSKEPVE